MMPPDHSVDRFPPDVIRRADWTRLRLAASSLDVEDLLAEGGIEVTYETIRRWVSANGPKMARRRPDCVLRTADRSRGDVACWRSEPT